MAITDYSPSASLNTSISGINIGEGMAREDMNDALRQCLADLARAIGNFNVGTLPSGTTVSWAVSKTANGDTGGATDFRGWQYSILYQGNYGAAQIMGQNPQMDLRHTAGIVTNVYGVQGYNRLGLSGSSVGSIGTSIGIDWHTSHEGITGTIGEAIDFRSADVDLLDGTGTITRNYSFFSKDQGHATRVIERAVGFHCEDYTAGASLTASFVSEMSVGLNKYSFLGLGTAPTVLNHKLRVGDLTGPSEYLEVAGNALVTGVYKVGANQVVGARQTGCPAAATDLATALTLLNFLRTALLAHGAIS